jgi:hypothetical protein
MLFTGVGAGGDRVHDAAAEVLVDEADGDSMQGGVDRWIWVRMSMQ